MDRSSYFIENKALFGGYPTQDSVRELEREGVRYFVDLTVDNEKKITPYKTDYVYIRYPIIDHHVPYNWKSFAKFIINISEIIENLEEGELLYLHCKGGHSRSGIVVASILCYMFNIPVNKSLEHTSRCHSVRKVMKDKWRKIGSPQTRHQKTFIYKFFEPLYFYKAYRVGITSGFSNFSLHPVEVPGIGIFPTSEAAFNAHKNLSDKEYVKKQMMSKTPIISKCLANNIEPSQDWEEKKDEIMEKVIKLKFDQHENIRNRLINTGLRKIIAHTRSDSYWGDGDTTGENKLGKILEKVRNSYYKEM